MSFLTFQESQASNSKDSDFTHQSHSYHLSMIANPYTTNNISASHVHKDRKEVWLPVEVIAQWQIECWHGEHM